MFDYGFNGPDTFVTALFIIIPVCIIGVFIYVLVKGISTWNKNNHSPRLTVEASVVTKREDVSYHRFANNGDITGAHGYHSTSSTSYYITFQIESGDRMELCVNGTEYGMLAEGDCGKLTFQGTRYLGFERVY